MVPALLLAGGVAAGVAIPVVADHTNVTGWLPWGLVGLGLAGLLLGLFDTDPKVDPKSKNWRSNAVVMIFGPTGSRFVLALIGGAFLGGGIGLFVG